MKHKNDIYNYFIKNIFFYVFVSFFIIIFLFQIPFFHSNNNHFVLRENDSYILKYRLDPAEYESDFYLLQNFKNNNYRELFSEENDYHELPAFIHIPKTGGRAVEGYLKNYSDYIEFKGHRYNAKDFKVPILVFRQPKERFISYYKYWKQEHLKETKSGIDYSVDDVINLIKEDNTELLLNPYYLTKRHYMPQTVYIDKESYSKTIIIRYNKNNEILKEKLYSVFNYLKIPINYDIPLHYFNETNSTDIDLTPENIKWINNYYKKDFELWNKLNQNPELFRFVA